MRLSKLIKKAQEAMKEYGDIPVYQLVDEDAQFFYSTYSAYVNEITLGDADMYDPVETITCFCMDFT